jgi:hypothetical protein
MTFNAGEDLREDSFIPGTREHFEEAANKSARAEVLSPEPFAMDFEPWSDAL